MTDTLTLFMVRGGTLIRSRVISPELTACRCSQMASMCHPWTYGAGSTSGHAAWMKSVRLSGRNAASNASSVGRRWVIR
jgi:hypothetical protein